MYLWRKLTDEQRKDLLQNRKAFLRPWHAVPHRDGGDDLYMLTGACYEHAPYIGHSAERIAAFETAFTKLLEQHSQALLAWCILPNHYHALVRSAKVRKLLWEIGDFHGRTSYDWNGIENTRGRKVFCGCAESQMKSEGHFYATLNYIHHNPVRHGYVQKWCDWPYSSAANYLDQIGPEEAGRRWREYPIDKYGDGWDAPEL